MPRTHDLQNFIFENFPLSTSTEIINVDCPVTRNTWDCLIVKLSSPERRHLIERSLCRAGFTEQELEVIVFEF